MRLIDADLLIGSIKLDPLFSHIDHGIVQMINLMPTVEAVPLEDLQSMEATCKKLQDAIAAKGSEWLIVHAYKFPWFDRERDPAQPNPVSRRMIRKKDIQSVTEKKGDGVIVEHTVGSECCTDTFEQVQEALE